MQNFYWFDLLVLGVTLILGLKGMFNGLVKEFFGLLGIVGGVLIAAHFSSAVSVWIQEYLFNISNQDLAIFVAFVTILIVFWILCLLVGFGVCKLVRLSGLAFVDRLGGFLFACVKVFSIFAILMYCLMRISFLEDKIKPYVNSSFTYPLLEKAGFFIMNEPLVKTSIESVNSGFQDEMQ